MKNSITIKNTSKAAIEQSVADMANMYASTSYVHPIEIYESTENKNTFFIKFPNQPDFDRFAYFVNYLAYPTNIQNYHPIVFGIWELQEKIKLLPFEIGATIGLYLPKKDDEYDNVYVLNSNNKVYKYAFYSEVFDVDFAEYKYSEIVKPIGRMELYKTITPSQAVIDKLNKPWWKFW